MTVAIGLVCSDGVVVASDSLASGGSQGWVASKATKVFKAPRLPLIWTASGSVHMIEEVATTIREMDAEIYGIGRNDSLPLFLQPALESIRSQFTNHAVKRMREIYTSALPNAEKQADPRHPGHHVHEAEFLFLGFTNGQPFFLHLDEFGGMNWVHLDNKFRSIGSGGDFAAAGAALLENYVQADLAVEQGLQVAYRAIEATCRISTALVRTPVQLAVADADGTRILDEDAIRVVQHDVESWTDWEKNRFLQPAPERPEEVPPKF